MAKKVEVKIARHLIEATKMAKEIAAKNKSIKGFDFDDFENDDEFNIHIVAVSGAAKLGPITCTFTCVASCPHCCGCRKICYAKNGNCRNWFMKTSAGLIGMAPWELKNWLKNHAHTDLIRHNETGDICTPGTNDIDEWLLELLIDAYKPYHAYTYTHAEKTERNLKLMKKATDEGFVISASCETLEEVKKVMKAGVNAVITVGTMEDKVKTVDGVKIVRCPYYADNTRQCANCKLCSLPKRNYAIAFPVHGCKANKARKSGELLDI